MAGIFSPFVVKMKKGKVKVVARSVGGGNVRGEKPSVRGQFFGDSPAHRDLWAKKRRKNGPHRGLCSPDGFHHPHSFSLASRDLTG
jgi:hypothetical protein